MPEKNEKKEVVKPALKSDKKVLIIEDEQAMAKVLVLKLARSGIFAKAVHNGATALKEIKKTKYNLILLDLVMPEIDGFGVLEEMKRVGIKIPVIVLSNLGQVEDEEKAKKLGARDYFVKSDTSILTIIEYVKRILKV